MENRCYMRFREIIGKEHKSRAELIFPGDWLLLTPCIVYIHLSHLEVQARDGQPWGSCLGNSGRVEFPAVPVGHECPV